MPEKFLLVYQLEYALDWSAGEYDVFEGTEEEAIEFAGQTDQYANYGHRGVRVYRISEPVFEKMAEWA